MEEENEDDGGDGGDVEAWIVKAGIDPTQFNWFKYLLENHLNLVDDEGNKSALQSADSYISLLNIVTSTKSDDDIQEELICLVGFHNFELLGHLI
jgi:hypothetical protein